MTCPDCGAPTVTFAVPEHLRAYAPEGSSHASVCTRCLRTHPAAAPSDQDFSRLGDFFPRDEAGAALALVLGLLDSLALNRAAVAELCEQVERAGGDALLTLDRLAQAEGVEPHFDLDRRRAQLAQFLG